MKEPSDKKQIWLDNVNDCSKDYSTPHIAPSLFPSSAPLALALPHCIDNKSLLDTTQWSLNDGDELHRCTSLASSGSVKRNFSTVFSPQSSRTQLPSKKHQPRHASHLRFTESNALIIPQAPGEDVPLRFSNPYRQRPVPPQRFSSAEAAARLFNQADTEMVHQAKAVRHTQGVKSPDSSYRQLPIRTPSTEKQIQNKSHTFSSTKVSDQGSEHAILHQIGIVELLDEDDRLTFIVDLGEGVSYGTTAYSIIFVNKALRHSSAVLDQIQGHSSKDSPATYPTITFPSFTDWATSTDKDRQRALSFAGVVWNNTTLRERLRIFKAQPWTSQNALLATQSGILASPVFGKENSTPLHTGALSTEVRQDYFGSAAISSSKHHRDSSVERPKKGKDSGSPQSKLSRLSDLWRARSPSAPKSLSARDDGSVDGAETWPSTPGPVLKSLDWTQLPVSKDTPNHIRFVKSVDWAATPLGPMSSWSLELRMSTMSLMSSPFPAAMYWGSDLTILYNEAYIDLAGHKHPRLMGRNYRDKDAWEGIWEFVSAAFEAAMIHGISTMKDEDQLYISRLNSEILEETYFQWGLVPIVGGEGKVVGVSNPAFEKTRRKLSERRMNTLRRLGENTSKDRELKAFWPHIVEALNFNERDAPFFSVHAVFEDIDSDSQSSVRSSVSKHQACVLQGSHGVPEDHPVAVDNFGLKDSSKRLAKIFGKAMKQEEPLFLSSKEGTLDPEILADIEWQGLFSSSPREAVCCAITLPSDEKESRKTLGFLFMGLNPHRPYDEDYQLYVELLCRQIRTTMATVVFLEEEIARSQKATQVAEKEKLLLSNELRKEALRAAENESKFTMLTELNPVGLFTADVTGKITYCNSKWYDNMCISKEEVTAGGWMSAIADEDLDLFKQKWADLVEDCQPLDAEFRTRTQAWGVVDYSLPSDDCSPLDAEVFTRAKELVADDSNHWVLIKMQARSDERGIVKEFVGCIADISIQKRAELQERHRVETALAIKREQESFFDMTSHELRNPLGAVLQTADLLDQGAQNLVKSLGEGDFPPHIQEIVELVLESVATIRVCATHQTRIVEDILTMSKLDATKLQVEPDATRPLDVVTEATKMVQPNIDYNKIDYKINIDTSLQRLEVDYVKMDPSRVKQVLINLTTNAIKFTSRESKRQISITLSASLAPEGIHDGVKFTDRRMMRPDLTDLETWGNGQPVYIYYTVEDTGKGLSEVETEKLFQRFQQANNKTHITYGGSGLGLYICRELSEIHGGSIGVMSKLGKGSRFCFFVKTRRVPAPPKPSNQLHQLSDVSVANPTILVVEDNEVNSKVLIKALKMLGCTVYLAENGQECLDYIAKSTYCLGGDIKIDLVLMDKEMPVMDGLTCIRTIRGMEEVGTIVAHVPTIATSANARDQQVTEMLEAGMDDCVSKPFTTAALRPKIQALTARYHAPD